MTFCHSSPPETSGTQESGLMVISESDRMKPRKLTVTVGRADIDDVLWVFKVRHLGF